MKTILVVDDSLDIQASLKFLLEDEGHHYQGALTPDSALEYVAKKTVDLVLLDMNFNQATTTGEEGLDTIQRLNQIDPLLPIIVMTGWATLELAIKALSSGASDFIEKPWQDERLTHAITTQLEKRRDKQYIARINQEKERSSKSQPPFSIAYSEAKKQLIEKLNNLAKSDMNVLLTGENGTGKSYYAKYLHTHSLRSEQSFIALNMGAINDELFNSEVFGHKKGSFTDAKSDRIGAFTLAENGTLFLDEIANLPLVSQAKLLHVLEERKYSALGSEKILDNKSRIISATNANLADALINKQFRQDLYYRLNTIEIEIPPLRQCKEDILPLAKQFLAHFCQQYDKPLLTLTTAAEQALLSYDFPGNIRELKHIIERVIFMVQSDQIDADDLMLKVINPRLKSISSIGEREGEAEAVLLAQTEQDMTQTLDDVIENAMNARLAYFSGNASKAATSLGLSRSAWYRKMAKYDKA